MITLILVFVSCSNHSPINSYSSIDSISVLLQKDSLNIELLNQRAQLYIEQDEINLAKKDIDNAYSVFKNDTDLLLKRGYIYYSLNQTRISKESWERCINIDPNNLDCREKLTNLLCAVKYPNCKSMIDTLDLLNNGIVSTRLIVYLKELREYERAINLLKNRLSQFPKEKGSLSLLSIMYSDTSSMNTMFNTSLADNYFKEIIELYPNDYQVYYNFGKSKQDLSEYEDAVNLYNMAIDIDPNAKESYYNLGFCYMQLEEYRVAINYFTSALKLDSSFLLAYHARAYLYDLIGEKEKARADWKNCLMLNPSYIPAIKALSS